MEEFLWAEKYRPKTVADVILPPDLKSVFQRFVDDRAVPNLLLAGRSGIGKTTVAIAMLEELGCDYYMINGSLRGNIDTLRNEIQTFASAMSLSGGRKYVLLDEADYLNPNSTQPALRAFMEEFSVNTGFIFTCNFKNRIIEALHSRCSVIDFRIDAASAPQLAGQFLKRAMGILEREGVKAEASVVAEVVQKHFPDWRRVLNELQRYSAVSGVIDQGILKLLHDDSVKQLVDLMRGKDYTGMRKWVADNTHVDQNTLYRRIYDTAHEHFTSASVPRIVLVIGKYQFQAAFVADAEINTMCCLTELLIEGEFK